MRIIRCRSNFKLSTIIFITFIAINSIFAFTSFFLEGVGDQRKFDTIKFDENITILSGSLKTIDLNLEEGEEFEIIYTIQVKESLPIDIWLVNNDNYLLLISDVNFLYFIDGSDQQVAYTKKIVDLTEVGIYKLVLANYNNQTVNVNIIYEIRTYSVDSGETSSKNSSIFLYPLIVAVIILVGLLFIFLFKARNYKRAMPKAFEKPSSKNEARKRKSMDTGNKIADKESPKKAKKQKVKKATLKVSNKDSPKKLATPESDEIKPKTSDKISPSFCGYCGESVNTPFCLYCGHKV